MEKQTIKIELTANLDYSALVRHVADEVFQNAQFSKAWCGRLKLVVDELFMNAVRYGSTKDKSLVHLTFEYDGLGIRFVIEDDGSGPQAKSAEELKALIQRNESNHDLTRTSGRGLSMITRAWTDSMVISSSAYGGIAMAFEKKLENASQPPPSLPTELQPQPLDTLKVTLAALRPSPAIPLSAPRILEPIPAGAPVFEVKLAGEIDQSNLLEKIAPISNQVATLPNGSILILDFKDLTYINSTFIGSLAAWYKALQGKQGRIRLRHVNDSVREILTLVGLINVLEVE